VPQTIKLPPDKLLARLDFFTNSIMLYTLDNGVITALHVSADDVATSLLSIANLSTGLLPENALWHVRRELECETAIYEPPRVRRLAVALEAFKAPERFTIPVPPLIFICNPRKPPRVFAVKRRPQKPDEPLFSAPFFNIYSDGRSCPGTQAYPEDVGKIPEMFFVSFFSLSLLRKVSVAHPDSIYALWKSLEGQKEYPLDDLVKCGTLKDVL
jgi:hypothetical protein